MNSIYVLDTSVLSEMAPGRKPLSVEAVEWLREREQRSRISVISVLEFERGISRLLRQGHSAKAGAILNWVEQLLGRYAGRVIDINDATARCAGRIEDRAIGRGFDPGLADALIAATAIMHDGMVLTRNLKHFEQLGVKCVDPFAI